MVKRILLHEKKISGFTRKKKWCRNLHAEEKRAGETSHPQKEFDPQHLSLVTVCDGSMKISLDKRAGISVFTEAHYKAPVCCCRVESEGSERMAAQANFTTRFIRKTQLGANEYHKNFYKLDEEIIAAITSEEADKVTPLMSKIYLRLVNAPDEYWEREGVLRFEAQWREGKQVKAWDVLCAVVGVASATANKAITWLHEQGIIGYFAGKNGVGLRIFLNRAAASIGVRGASAGQKILRLAAVSSARGEASRNEAAFKDSYAALDNLDTDLNSHAPKDGADTTTADKTLHDSTSAPVNQQLPPIQRQGREVESATSQTRGVMVAEFVERLRDELEPCVKMAAAQAASQAAAREVAQTRRWFEERALPKAVRVAQHETYDLLRNLGTFDPRSERARADLQVGRSPDNCAPAEARPLTPQEVMELAETCVALLETQGKRIDVTLSEISAEGGGWVLAEDAARVREAAQVLIRATGESR